MSCDPHTELQRRIQAAVSLLGCLSIEELHQRFGAFGDVDEAVRGLVEAGLVRAGADGHYVRRAHAGPPARPGPFE